MGQHSTARTGALEGPRSAAPTLRRRERTGILAVAAVAVVASTVLALVRGTGDPARAVLEVAVTALFAGFAFSPLATVIALAAAMGIALWAGSATPMLLALAVATGFVARTASTMLLLVYGGILLLSTAAALASAESGQLTSIVVYLLLSTVSGAIGLLLRYARGQEEHLRRELENRALKEREIRRSERVAITDELHDVVARDLTVIAMQAELMEREADPAARAESLRSVRESARHALGDLHRLVGLVGDETRTPEPPGLSLRQAIDQAERDLGTGGWALSSTVDVDVAALPPIVDSTLARLVLELSTNVLKHGEPGPVSIALTEDGGGDGAAVTLAVRNRVRRDAARGTVTSVGYGSIRMAERAAVLGGTLDAGPQGEHWVARATIPVTD